MSHGINFVLIKNGSILDIKGSDFLKIKKE